MAIAAVSPQIALAIGVGSLLLARRSSKGRSNLLDTEKPPVLVERGSSLPRLIGVDSVAGVLTWENPTRVVLESFAGGAGGKGIGSASGGSNEVIYAQGQHQLVIGPGARLSRIRQDGRVIWPLFGNSSDGITPAIAPSGTQFACRNAPDGGGSEGSFRIYWGEIDQPIDPLFADGTAKGIATNEGFVMYVIWDDKRLGGTRRWPVVDYDIEVRPYSPEMRYDINGDGSVISWDPELISGRLPGSSPWIKGFRVVDETRKHPILNVVNGPETVVHVCQDRTAEFVPGEKAELRGVLANGAYRILSSVFTPSAIPCASIDLIRIESNLKMLTGVGTTVNGTGSVLPDVSMPDLTGYAPPVDDDVFPVLKNRVIVQAVAFGVLLMEFRANNPGPVIPDGATAPNQLGQGTHRMTFYQRKLPGIVNQMTLKFRAGGVDHFSKVAKDANNDYTEISNSGDVTFSYSHFDVNYLEVSLEFEVPANLVGSTFFQGIELHQDPSDPFPPAFEFQFLACGVTAATDPFMGYASSQNSQTGNTLITLAGVPFLLNPNEGHILPFNLISNVVAGANFAHVIHEILTLPRPHGIGDISSCLDDSLVALGAVLEAEEMRSHYKVEQGNRHRNIMDRALVELSINCYWDAVAGVWGFRAVRPDMPDYVIPEDMLISNDVDEAGLVRNAAPESILYKFRNQQRNLTADDVSINGQGEPENIISGSLQKVELDTVRDLEVAEKIASRLYLIESSMPTQRDIHLNRDALSMRAGDVADVGGLLGEEGYLLIMGIQPVAMSQDVAVTTVTSPFIGQPVLTLTSSTGTPPPKDDPNVVPDFAQRLFELSTYASDRVLHLALRIPASNKSSIANTYLSRDGLTYQPKGTIQGVTGGEIVGNFTPTLDGTDYWGQIKTSPEVVENGPTLLVSDPEFSSKIRSLSSEELQRGDQWLIVGKEVMFVQRFLLLGNNLWQAQGVIRARFEHGMETYLHGRIGFVVQADKLPIIDTDAVVGGAETIKMQTRQNGLQENLSDVVAQPIEAQGLAARPPYVGQAAVTSGPGTWHASINLNLSWPFATKQAFTLAKQSGISKQGEDKHQGEFVVEVWDVLETTLLLQLFVTENSTAITGSSIESALTGAGEPANSDIKVKIQSKGYSGLYANAYPAVLVPHGTI